MTSSQPPSTPKRKLRWYQFSLRTLLIFVTLFGIVCSWFAVKMRQAKRQREAVEAIIKNRGEVRYDYQEHDFFAKPPGPEWLRNWLGEDFLCNVVLVRLGRNPHPEPLKDLPNIRHLELYYDPNESNTGEEEQQDHDPLVNRKWDVIKCLPQLREIYLNGFGITDTELEYVRGLSQLEILSLDLSSVTDKGLACLNNFKQLRELSLIQCYGITDEGLIHLKGLNNLEKLNLNLSLSITDAGLEKLKDLSQLRELELYSTSITDSGMKYLRDLKKLQWLMLSNTQVGDHGLKQLQCLTNLKTLWIGMSDKAVITDDGIKYLDAFPQLQSLSIYCTESAVPHFACLKNLRYLELYGEQITDNGLESLKSLSHLEDLHLYDTKISSEGFINLKKSLPKVCIDGLPSTASD
jgi:Leucine-rich repeat (LRR) protein